MKVIRQYDNVIYAETAKITLSSHDIAAIVVGDNLANTGGAEFGINYIQLAILNDDDYERAEEILKENGFN